MKRHARGLFYVFGATLAILSVRPCSAADLQQQGIHWRKSYHAAAQEASRTHKPMLMQVTASWCGACQSMFSQTFSDNTVVERVNSSFVPFQIDADRHAELISALGVQAFPTTIVIDSDLTILSRIAGFRPSTSFGDALAAAAQKSANRNPTTTKADPSTRARPVSLEQPANSSGDGGLVATVLRLINGR
ncbi:MAG: DUF255 domain-containing protein [Planctomycetales bacterium]